MDHSNSFADFPQVTHIWNRTNTHSVSTKRNYKWDNSIYRHIADMLDFTEETKNKQYKDYVLKRVEMHKQMATKKDFRQL